MAGRRGLITGVANAFGVRLARRLADDAGVERVVGVDTRAVGPDLAERIDVVQADLRSPDLPPVVRAAAVDTVVHNARADCAKGSVLIELGACTPIGSGSNFTLSLPVAPAV